MSFLDFATNKYRHVLLVEPTSDTDFAAITGHGHGLFWSGNYLVVATSGSVLRVFDVRHVWRTDTSSEVVGLGADGKYHALARLRAAAGRRLLSRVRRQHRRRRRLPELPAPRRGRRSTSVWIKAPKNTENLSHWPAARELWLISEQLRERVTAHILWQ
ncbi:hypothetical protein [Kribbella lupini]|uniref:Uncharacterized protein n=1 Tax=Kribbella lupini TaxID=291602 RepID=A0ABN2A362_9ACTN